MKTEADRAESCGGGWMLVLALIAVGAALFAPLPTAGVAPAREVWLDPEQLGVILALLLMGSGFWAFRRRFWPRGPLENRSMRSGLLLIVPQAVLLRVTVELKGAAETLPWDWWPHEAWLWVPWFLTTGFAVILLGGRFGVLTSLSGVFLLYLLVDPGALPLVGCLVASLAGVVLLRRSPTRTRVFRAGFGAGVLLGIIAAVQGGLDGVSPEWIAAAAVVPVAVGLASAFAVLAFLPLMELALGELSDVTLVEYGSDHPLLDELKEQAPGTWHHTLNVADLAEKAAAAVGARALFCKTAVLYHDIGKLKNPSLFAENIDGPSPHDDLDPRESARRIIEHVTHGLELARKNRLPRAFRQIIAEHHGVSLVRFFYAKACDQLREGETPESLRESFCYPGPPPSSRESGIIALADTVEAATRALGPKSEAELRTFVRKLIADRLVEGELAHCQLTLAELARVQDTFVGWLKARNHQRPAYPKAASQESDLPDSAHPAGTHQSRIHEHRVV